MENSLTDIDYCNKSNTFKWLLATISFIQFVLLYYIVKNNELFNPIYLSTLASYVIGFLFITPKLFKHKKLNSHEVYTVMFIANINWLVMAYAVTAIWGQHVSGEKIILIGFFSMLICFSTSKTLLVLGTLPLVLGHIFYQCYYAQESGTDLLVSVSKFPLFIIAIIITHVNHNKRLINSHKKLLVLNEQLTKIKDTMH